MTGNLLRAALLITVFTGAARLMADEIRVPSVLIKLIEQVEVPAREAGVLAAVNAREGDLVSPGAPLAQIEDTQARFDKRRAELEHQGARRAADSDVKVRFARKSLEVAEADLRRALESSKRFAQSVSQSELDHLRLLVQKSTLEIEQAQLEIELAQALRDVKQHEVEVAQHQIERRQVVSPLAGVVVEINRHRGEWVEPGQTIVRLLRLDRLRAEGLVPAQSVDDQLKGRAVKLTVPTGDGQSAEYAGQIVFVSPEVDPVNGQVRVWAEIENNDLKLRPGVQGSLVITEPAAAR